MPTDRTLEYQVPAEFNAWANTTASFTSWVDNFRQQLMETQLGDSTDHLQYHGSVDDTVEFGGGPVQTDFNPYYGSPFTAYNIGAPIEEMWGYS